MSNIEHLLENAIASIESNNTYDSWLKQNTQQSMLQEVKASSSEIWTLAQYCVYVYKPGIVVDMVEKAENDYGYKWPVE